MRYKDASELIGQKYGRLLVLNKSEIRKNGHVHMSCLCDCGAHVAVAATYLVNGKVKSCGCYQRERRAELNKMTKTTHGCSKELLYKVWKAMYRRCFDARDEAYTNYGGRGIKVCDTWAQDYLKFREWAKISGYKKGLTIERIDVNKGYTPDNCTWIPRSKQPLNRRNVHIYNGRPACEIAKENGITSQMMHMRLRYYGWPLEEAIGVRPHQYKTNWGNKQKFARKYEG